MAQISYLSVYKESIYVSLHPSDAMNLFDDLTPIGGERHLDGNQEINDLSQLVGSYMGDTSYDFPNTIIDDIQTSGFFEGNRIVRSHIVIERNARIRQEFFACFPNPVCDICRMNTSGTYSCPRNIIDIHHVLPLSSGTQVLYGGTVLYDLRPLCPTCHRAVHIYYDDWLRRCNVQDFRDKDEAQAVYSTVQSSFKGHVYG